MKSAARKLADLSEQAEAAAGSAEVMRNKAREYLRVYGEICAMDTQMLFGRTVRQHREDIESIDRLLAELCVGGQWAITIASGTEFGKDAEAIVRSADVKLRASRALLFMLVGDRTVLETETLEVRREVDSAIETHAAFTAGKWTKEERDAFGGKARPLSPELEARIIGS